jgi:U3 small nucleolar ribonucleoprotein protein IMP3
LVRLRTSSMRLTQYRNMEDFVTWVDSSKIKRNIMKYRDKLDDFELEAL